MATSEPSRPASRATSGISRVHPASSGSCSRTKTVGLRSSLVQKNAIKHSGERVEDLLSVLSDDNSPLMSISYGGTCHSLTVTYTVSFPLRQACTERYTVNPPLTQTTNLSMLTESSVMWQYNSSTLEHAADLKHGYERQGPTNVLESRLHTLYSSALKLKSHQARKYDGKCILR